MIAMKIQKKTILLLLCLPITFCVHQITFCMPTASRDVSYLNKVIHSYIDQRVLRMDGIALAILDVDNSTGGMAKKMQRRERALCNTPDREGLPSCRVRQQGLDVAVALEQCAQFTSAWIVLVEDDCIVCEEALDEVVITLSSLHTGSIAMAKFSKFVRATAFPADIVFNYTKSVRDRLYEYPYDITVIEQWSSGRRVYIHKRNLFHHIGHVSTEPTRNSDEYRKLYEALRNDVCFEPLM